MSEQLHYLTQAGFDELQQKLHYLRTNRRQEIAQRLHLAMSEGGELAENAEYEDAKNDQAFLEGEILRLEAILSNAVIINEDGPKDRVGIGDHVTIREKGGTQDEVYHLVGAAEAKPEQGRISYMSPLGKALMNKRVGDKVVVKAPDGELVFKVVAIE